MKIIDSLENLPSIPNPVSLTIGNFDGVHVGHQALLKHVSKRACAKNGQSLAITFSKHPRSILSAKNHASICLFAHKCKLLEELNIDFLLTLPFTLEFSEQTADFFLEKIHEKFAFSDLILGQDALFGKNRHATKEHVAILAKRFNFTVEYLNLLEIDNKIVSSSLIRTLIQKGEFEELKKFLGRNYSIYGIIIPGEGKGKTLGFPTANLDVTNLALPPFGVYSITAFVDGQKEKAIANLGIAPTLRNEKTPRLEIHFLNLQKDLYGKHVEVVFDRFIREEKRFSSVEELQKQIAEDINTTQKTK